MNNCSKTLNINSIDLSKFIMSIFVVAIHTNPFFDSTNDHILTIYDSIVRMAVPFFFLSSGYLLALKFADFNQAETNIPIARNYLKKIARMYLSWSIVYAPLAIYNYWSQDISILAAIISYIRGFILIGEHYNSWHLWYLLSSIYALLVIIVLFRLRMAPAYMLLISALTSIISIGMDVLVQYTGTLPTVLLFVKKVIAHTTVNGRILQGLVFIPIGIYMANREFSPRICAIVFTLSFIGNYYLSGPVVSSYLLFIASIALFGIILCIKIKDHPIYPALRRLSTKVYLIHMYVWTLYYFLVFGEKRYGIHSFWVTTIVSLCIGYLHLIYEKHITPRTEVRRKS